jgi:hypothetical protein
MSNPSSVSSVSRCIRAANARKPERSMTQMVLSLHEDAKKMRASILSRWDSKASPDVSRDTNGVQKKRVDALNYRRR